MGKMPMPRTTKISDKMLLPREAEISDKMPMPRETEISGKMPLPRGTGILPVLDDIGLVRLPGRGKDDTSVEIQVRDGAYLPHWTCDGGIYFVTFRLADSLPKGILLAWARERDELLRRAIVRSHRQKCNG